MQTTSLFATRHDLVDGILGQLAYASLDIITLANTTNRWQYK